MDVPLSPELEAYLAEQVRSGRFENASAVVEAALRLQRVQLETERLRLRLEEAERQFESGEYVIADQAYFKGLKQSIRERAAKSPA